MNDLQARIEELEQQLRQRTFELEVLSDLSQRIHFPLNDRDLLQLLLEHLDQALPVDVSAGLIASTEGCDLILRPIRPLGNPVKLMIQHRLCESFNLMTGRATTCSLDLEPEVTQLVEVKAEQAAIQQLGSLLMVPMIVPDVAHTQPQQTVGMLLIGTEAEATFNQNHIRFLYTLANQGAVSLSQLRSHLQAEKYRLGNIITALPEGVVLLDTNGRITLANAAAQTALTRLVSHPLEEPLTCLGDQPLTHWLTAQGPSPQWLEVAAQDNPDVVYEINIQPIADPQQCSYWLMVIRDISDRKAVERLKDEFVGIVNHELRTPLSLIQGPLKLLATGQLGTFSEQGQRVLDIATQGIDRLVHIVNDVLDLQYLESGQITLVKQSCNTGDLIAQAIKILQARATQARVILSAQPTCIPLWGDPSYLIQVLTHLIGNAIKFSPPGSTVDILAETTQTSEAVGVIFSIRDRGPGIPADKLETIFQRFQQLDMSQARQGSGLGIGLTICARIVKHHDGQLWANSTLGQGSTFYVLIPHIHPPEDLLTPAQKRHRHVPRNRL